MTVSSEVPEDSPFAGLDPTPEGHEANLDLFSEVFDEADGETIQSAMCIVTTPAGADTGPTIAETEEWETTAFVQLAAHLAHLAEALDAPLEQVAMHACHVYRDHKRAAEGDAGE